MDAPGPGKIKTSLFVEEPGIPKVRRAFYGAHSSSVLPGFLLIYALTDTLLHPNIHWIGTQPAPSAIRLPTGRQPV